ncbi:uncharacterized protein HKW66_Vig0130480 [Vigna angularis]|uniref:Uncharacterized protein n=2 Tax=NPAAA clade TaxID=2231382 RepID=A0A8T0K269_PHAAN|nr:uncharacterized protein HKW66_Vig0130480 [Vigna angularis]
MTLCDKSRFLNLSPNLNFPKSNLKLSSLPKSPPNVNIVFNYKSERNIEFYRCDSSSPSSSMPIPNTTDPKKPTTDPILPPSLAPTPTPSATGSTPPSSPSTPSPPRRTILHPSPHRSLPLLHPLEAKTIPMNPILHGQVEEEAYEEIEEEAPKDETEIQVVP